MTCGVRVRHGGWRFIGWILALLLAPGAIPVAAAADPPAVVVRTGEHPDHSRVVFDWPVAVGAKVDDGRAGQLVVSFDRPARFDLKKAGLKRLSRIAGLEPVAGQSALRITLRGRHGYKLSDVGGRIVLDILDDAAGGLPTATDARQIDAKAEMQDAANAIAAAAPADAAAADHPVFLAVTEPAREPAEQPAAPPEPIPVPLFDPQAWRGGESFVAAQAALPKLLGADPSGGPALLKLAQFHFAWRHADEALSVLETLKARDPTLASRIDVQALADAARILSGRPHGLLGVFERPDLRERPEAELWRAAAAALAGQTDKARPAFAAGKPALAAYPPDLRTFFSLLAMQTALERNEVDTARDFQTVADAAHPRDADAAMLEALTGMLLAAQQHTDDARRHLLKAAQAATLRPQIIARLALIRLDLSSGKLTKDAAATALEQLYYMWEGDTLQLAIIEQLAALLIDLKRYDQAFNAIALAQKQFPQEPRAAALAGKARDLYRQLMTDDGLAALDPLATVALFDGHRDLLPGGTDGIAIERALAKRLAQLDLAEPAVRLLQDTLKAAPANQQAEIATDIAGLRLAAGDAEGALKALDASQSADPPAALRDRRAQLRANALARSGRAIEALAAMGTATDPTDDRARADLYWQNGEWELAAKDYLAAFDAADKGGAAAERDAHLLLRATAALLLAGKDAEVAAIRDKYGPVLAKSSVAAAFEKLSRADAGVKVLAQPDVSAAVVKLD